MARVLVTNDDGVDAPGLIALALGLAEHGHDLLVVAPLDERSGAGAAIGTLSDATRLRLERRRWPELPDVAVYGLDAAPALCVIAARLGAFGPPADVVVAGINPGLNTGRAIMHSGTVGAALTAANHGLSGLAVSIAGPSPIHWDTAAVLAAEALAWLVEAPARTTVNLNVPDLPLDAVAGVRWAEPAPLGEWHAVVSSTGDDHLGFSLRRTEIELPEASDTAVVAAGHAAVTLMRPPSPADWAPVAQHLQERLDGARDRAAEGRSA